MEIEKITILKGYGKNDQSDQIESVTLCMGDIVSIVGPTGSGKTTLINDIALFANNNTPSRRQLLINDELPYQEYFMDPSKNPIAFITQHTNFLSDLPVFKFLNIHAQIRGNISNQSIIEETIDFANQLTGEPIILSSAMTELSGGQTRALLIADAVIIGNSPIILLDEIENAGIHRTKALELLKKYKKIFIFVTHDPRITLLSDFRIVMKNGAMADLIYTDDEEKEAVEEIKKLDDLMLDFRKQIREGRRIGRQELKNQLVALGYLSV